MWPIIIIGGAFGDDDFGGVVGDDEWSCNEIVDTACRARARTCSQLYGPGGLLENDFELVECVRDALLTRAAGRQKCRLDHRK